MRGRGSFRGTQRGRGRERPSQQHFEFEQSSPGPLMTNHLRDIDIEMEILKRKREMIQQEHELLDREREFSMKRQYIQDPPDSYSQSSRSGYSSNFYRQQGNKRQAVEQSPPRRYESPSRVDPWERNAAPPTKTIPKQRNYQNAFKPQPLLNTNVEKRYRPQNAKPSNQEFQPNKTKSFPPRKDFNPTKITKAKSRTPYVNRPAQEKFSTKSDDDFILRPDVVPSVRMNGRLELALGEILKEVKQKIDPVTLTLESSVFKVMKKIIRDRIRSVMMNKEARHLAQIVKQYRDKHPVHTDAELLALSRQAHACNLNKIICSETENPLKYFKTNMDKLLTKKLNEMFEIVKKAYGKTGSESSAHILKLVEKLPELKDTTETITVGDDPSEDAVISSQAKAESYSKLMDTLLDEKMPTLLQKYKSTIKSLIEQSSDYINIKLKIEEKTMAMACDLVTKKVQEEKNKPDCILIEDATPVIDISDDKPDESSSTKPTEVITVEDDSASTTDKGKSNNSTQNVPAKSQIQASKTGSKVIDYPYFVKLIGRPELPSRQAVYEFLEQFKPASIKKHKTVGNLLVLGFNEKEGCDRLLENSGIVISGNTLIIKSSEKVSATPLNQSIVQQNDTAEKPSTDPQGDTQEPQVESKNESDAILSIGSDLDEQINSLLSSIRNSEEASETQDSLNKSKTDEKNNTDDSKVDSNVASLDPISKDEEAKSNKDTLETISENVESSAMNEQSENKIADNDSIPNEKDQNECTDEKIATEQKDNVIEDSKDVKNGDRNGDEPTKVPEKTVDNNVAEVSNEKVDEKDPKASLKESGRATPTRTSARLASTPSTIKTRRASKLAQNN